MQGIMYKQELYVAIGDHLKTQTRRLTKGKPPRYKVDQVLYLKEPYRYKTEAFIEYKFSHPNPERGQWNNKMFMGATSARRFIKITAVRKERLHEISELDANLEGFRGDIRRGIYARNLFIDIWRKIHRKSPWRWEDNPEVYVYDFVLCTRCGEEIPRPWYHPSFDEI